MPVDTKYLPISLSPRFSPGDFVIAMQVQHSYKSSTNEIAEFYLLLTFSFSRFLSATEEITQILIWQESNSDFRTSRCTRLHTI